MLIFQYKTGIGSFEGTYDITVASSEGNAQLGRSIGASPSYVIVSAHNSQLGTGGGRAYIYNPSTGALLQTLDNPNANTNDTGDTFGSSVEICDTYAIVGAKTEADGGGSQSGKAYIFNPGTGAVLQTLDHPNPAAGGRFGYDVDISNTYAIVGCENAQRAYIFNPSSGANLQSISNPESGGFVEFGNAVAISDTHAVIGAPRLNAGGTDIGRAYIYDPSTGNLSHTLSNPTPSNSDHFGTSVAVDGDNVVVGARGVSSSTGEAYIFSASSGSLLHTLTNPKPNSNDYFGYDVEISGNNVIIGAYGDDSTNFNGGEAYVFSAATGALLYTLANPNNEPDTDDSFGFAVSIAPSFAAVGAYRDGTTGDNGAFYIFK